MPYYSWSDENTGYEIEVLRPHTQFEEPPLDGELPDEERGKERKWTRQISGGQTVQRGDSWGPGKGYW